jgi:hypothetical protein
VAGQVGDLLFVDLRRRVRDLILYKREIPDNVICAAVPGTNCTCCRSHDVFPFYSVVGR